ncbi:hypothetical protein Cgig2_015213 [Carnegiea gigantea]|uniref:Lipoxygenase n=1 Tax=Carnegiea gigantea TaxID=171969 RepID=A0A9Q1KRP5_9CARY|nr:hypothetical protein Cgig2_015213 [Carnegiea gigantea]
MKLLLKGDCANSAKHLPLPYYAFSLRKAAGSSIGRSKLQSPVFLSAPPKISSLKIKSARMSHVETEHHSKEKGAVEHEGENNKGVIHGTVVLIKKTVLGFNSFHASVLDRVHEMVARKVSLQLVSADNGDPGAFIIRNERHNEFYLKSVSLDGIPDLGEVHFVCNSWVYPAHHYEKDRMFFRNKTYLPHETPTPLRSYRAEELQALRGNGERELQEWDHVYDYAYYNDLGDPDSGPEYARPILGGSKELPYPRRGRTGRAPTKADSRCEGRLPLAMSIDVYVPRDERFGHLKMADFLSQSLKSVAHALQAALRASFDKTPTEFDSFEDALKIYEEGIKLQVEPMPKEKTYMDMLKGLIHIDGAPCVKFPEPHIIKDNKTAWSSDEEFAREMLAGVNPLLIRRLEDFPPVSKLDRNVCGKQDSAITKDHIDRNLEGLTVDEAIKKNRLFIHKLIPYLRQINTTSTKTYATRTILFLREDGTLAPLAIELSLPHPDGDELGAVSRVYTPSQDGVEGSLWQLAKSYVSVNDSGYHQLISHWLNTHAVIEPFIIATNRQLSVLHPIHKLLYPHFRDTMNINALARQILIGAEGILEKTVFPRKYAMEMSAALYKNWVFTDQALPKDLMKRGMAVKDPQSPHGYKLLIQDYPYAVDGLDIWSAIEAWVRDYCCYYYKIDAMVANDTELQGWWREIREEGHGDLKDEQWWPEMSTFEELTETCTIIIWVASALHAAVNFGQYPYAGYLPNRPTVSRRFMPEEGTLEYEELKSKPETAFLKTITSQFQTLLGISLIEILSRHSSDELYLGQRESHEWTADRGPIEASERFKNRLEEIEHEIEKRNGSGKWRNRYGPVNMPYTLLIPSSEGGVTAKGIPNSITI